MCSYWRAEPKRDLPLSFVEERVVPFIRQYGVEVTFISGGEPCLHPQLPQIVGQIKQAGSTITLITNGSHLGEVFEHIAAWVDAYLLSIDAGNAALHRRIRGLDNFSQMAAWPEKIKAKNPAAQVAYTCVLQKQNVEDIVDYYLRFSPLPCDALFFNVPELKPHCFGRQDTVPEDSRQNAQLSDREIELLESNLQKIQQLDLGRNKLSQSPEFFNDCVTYFKYLRGERVECDDHTCVMPFHSLVIDESQHIRPCFYLPFSFPFDPEDSDILNREDLREVRREILHNRQFREKYCRQCRQFQG